MRGSRATPRARPATCAPPTRSSKPRSRSIPRTPALRTRWGELFLATHQNNEAIKLFQEALEIDAAYAPAKIGLAKIAAGRYEEKTREWADQVIDETPDQALEAHLMLARARRSRTAPSRPARKRSTRRSSSPRITTARRSRSTR